MICTPHQIFLGVHIKDEMVGACGIWGRNKIYAGFWWVNLKKRDNLQDLGADGSIILQLPMNTYYRRYVDWIHLAEDTEKRRGIMNTVIDLSVPYNASEMLDYLGN